MTDIDPTVFADGDDVDGTHEGYTISAQEWVDSIANDETTGGGVLPSGVGWSAREFDAEGKDGQQHHYFVLEAYDPNGYAGDPTDEKSLGTNFFRGKWADDRTGFDAAYAVLIAEDNFAGALALQS